MNKYDHCILLRRCIANKFRIHTPPRFTILGSSQWSEALKMEPPNARIWGSPLTSIACLLLSLCYFASAADSDFDVLKYINPLIGSKDGGNVFAGATRPYGLAKPVAVSQLTPIKFLPPHDTWLMPLNTRTLMAKILAAFPQMAPTSPASARYTTREQEATQAWETFRCSHSYAPATRSTGASSESATGPRHTLPAASTPSPGTSPWSFQMASRLR